MVGFVSYHGPHDSVAQKMFVSHDPRVQECAARATVKKVASQNTDARHGKRARPDEERCDTKRVRFASAKTEGRPTTNEWVASVFDWNAYAHEETD